MEARQTWMNAEHAARLVGLDQSMLYQLAEQRRVCCFRVLGRVLFERADVLALIEGTPGRARRVTEVDSYE
jgi:hypothetical protein